MKILTKATSAAARWLGQKLRLTDGGFWKYYSGSDNYAGKSVSAQSALQLSVVWASVRLISQVVSTLPHFLYTRDSKGNRQLAKDHPLYLILHEKPNANMTAADFWECLVASLCLWGNAFALIHRDGKRILALDPLRPEFMTVKLSKFGEVEYHYQDSKGKSEVYTERNIFHIKGFSLDGLVGLSPISYARHCLGSAMAQDEVSGRIFANGLKPSGVVSTDQILNQKQRTEIRESVVSQVANSERAGGTIVLEAGMKYQPIAMNPEDAQLLQSRAFSVEELCRWFYNLPPILIGHSPGGQTMWGSGVEQVMMGWRVMGLGPLVVKIEQAVKRSLLEPEERRYFYSKISIEGLMRADAAGRAQIYATKSQNGLAHRNELRELEDDPPYEGGDVFTVQSNLMPVSQLGSSNSDAKAREAFKSWLDLPTFEKEKT